MEGGLRSVENSNIFRECGVFSKAMKNIIKRRMNSVFKYVNTELALCRIRSYR